MKQNNTIYYDLLLACTTPLLSDDKIKTIKNAAAQIDNWQTVIELAGIYRAAPILYDRLHASGITSVPANIFDQLQKINLANTVKNARMIQSLADIMDALDRADIPALTYKGPVLANEAYDNSSLRQFDDLDILVHKCDLKLAKQIIEGLGYSDFLSLPKNIEDSPFRPSKPYLLRHNDGGYDIDLSSKLTHDYFSFKLTDQDLWGKSRSVKIDGRTIRTISNEALVLFLCVHGSKHLWSRPSWISDIAGLLFKQGTVIEWQEVIRMAKAQDGLRMLLLGIDLAVKEQDVPMPPLLKELMSKDKMLETLSRDVRNSLRENAGKPETDDLNRLRFHLSLRQRMRSRLRYIILRGITPSYNDWRALKLLRQLYPLYYLTRPFRLILNRIRSIR